MKNQLIKDLPIYINGFTVTYLFTQKINLFTFIMFLLAIISFFWYGYNEKKSKRLLTK
jgi:hypothetical protein